MRLASTAGLISRRRGEVAGRGKRFCAENPQRIHCPRKNVRDLVRATRANTAQPVDASRKGPNRGSRDIQAPGAYTRRILESARTQRQTPSRLLPRDFDWAAAW